MIVSVRLYIAKGLDVSLMRSDKLWTSGSDGEGYNGLASALFMN